MTAEQHDALDRRCKALLACHSRPVAVPAFVRLEFAVHRLDRSDPQDAKFVLAGFKEAEAMAIEIIELRRQLARLTTLTPLTTTALTLASALAFPTYRQWFSENGIVFECVDTDGVPCQYRAKIDEDGTVNASHFRWYAKGGRWLGHGSSVSVNMLATPCRLVPIEYADLDPATRPPFGAV